VNYFKENSGAEKSRQNHNHIGRFGTALAAVRKQIEVMAMPPTDKEQAEEIARIIAEVMCLSPDAEISIGKEKRSVSVVQEIYGRIDFDRVRSVIRGYREATYKITHPIAYLRTSLYNSVFDFESKIENEVNIAMPHLAGGGVRDD